MNKKKSVSIYLIIGFVLALLVIVFYFKEESRQNIFNAPPGSEPGNGISDEIGTTEGTSATPSTSTAGEESECPRMEDKKCLFRGFSAGATLTEAYSEAKSNCEKEQEVCTMDQNKERNSNAETCSGTALGSIPTGCVFGSSIKKWETCALEHCSEFTGSQKCTYRFVNVNPTTGVVTFHMGFTGICEPSIADPAFSCSFSPPPPESISFVRDLDVYTCEPSKNKVN